MDKYTDELQGVLSDALGLLSEIIDGDQLFDPGTEEEQESRDFLLARHYEVRAEAVRIGFMPADPVPVDSGECDGSYTCTAVRHDATCLLTPGN